MTGSVRATRAPITLGSLTIDGFMLPDGSYRMSQTQAAECIKDDAVYARNFLTSRALKALRGEGYTPETFEVNSSGQSRGQTRIRGWTLDVVYSYWVYRCHKGNEHAFALVVALGTETLERRFDRAFNVIRSEDDWDKRLSNSIINQLENNLSEAFAEADAALNRERLLEEQLRQNGIEPWALPNDEEDDRTHD
jgi:hypothetical protein